MKGRRKKKLGINSIALGIIIITSFLFFSSYPWVFISVLLLLLPLCLLYITKIRKTNKIANKKKMAAFAISFYLSCLSDSANVDWLHQLLLNCPEKNKIPREHFHILVVTIHWRYGDKFYDPTYVLRIKLVSGWVSEWVREKVTYRDAILPRILVDQ